MLFPHIQGWIHTRSIDLVPAPGLRSSGVWCHRSVLFISSKSDDVATASVQTPLNVVMAMHNKKLSIVFLCVRMYVCVVTVYGHGTAFFNFKFLLILYWSVCLLHENYFWKTSDSLISNWAHSMNNYLHITWLISVPVWRWLSSPLTTSEFQGVHAC